MAKINVVSLFSGGGGLDIGFKKEGFSTVFATDFWKPACDTLQENNMAEIIINDDIRKIDFSRLLKSEDVDCVIGGPPCPPYSQTRHYLQNKKSGFQDEKAGFAVPEYFRVIKELDPKVFLFENVDGFMFKTHLEELEFVRETADQLGYKIFYRVVNSADYGVPQTRKRFICVGVKKELKDFEFPVQSHDKNGNAESGKARWITCGEALGDFDNITKEELQQRPGGKDYEIFCKIPAGENYLFYTEKKGCEQPLFKWKSRYWTFLLKLSPDRPSWTIQASFSQNQGPFHWKNRFLRIEEIKRIQTFPDDYRITGEFKDAWRQVGNAVPPKLASAFAKSIKEQYFNE